MTAIWQTTFSNSFFLMQIVVCLSKFPWDMFPMVYLTISQHWFIYWLGAVQAASHYLNQWWSSCLTHICVTRPQWIQQIDHLKFMVAVSPGFNTLRHKPYIWSNADSFVNCNVTPRNKLNVIWSKAQDITIKKVHLNRLRNSGNFVTTSMCSHMLHETVIIRYRLDCYRTTGICMCSVWPRVFY